jgi:chromosome segregation ATPase
MFKDKVDIKVIFIFILAGALILSFIFRPSKPINMYEDEISNLRKENEKFIRINDSLKEVNGVLDSKIDSLTIKVGKINDEINKKDKEIINLENDKDKISGIVRKLNANGVSRELTEYLERR